MTDYDDESVTIREMGSVGMYTRQPPLAVSKLALFVADNQTFMRTHGNPWEGPYARRGRESSAPRRKANTRDITTAKQGSFRDRIIGILIFGIIIGVIVGPADDGVTFVISLFCLFAFLIWTASKNPPKSRASYLCELFRFGPVIVHLVGSDLAGGKDRVILRGDGLTGVPDVVFHDKDAGEFVVAEAKGRYFDGNIQDYERYQMTLYLGLVEQTEGRPARGLIRYGCATMMSLSLDRDLYNNLHRRIPECLTTLESFEQIE